MRCIISQEHWLFTENIPSFAEKVGNVNIHATSGMDETKLLLGRPYGGCAILWKKSLNCIVSPIESGNQRIVAGLLSFHNIKTLLCNVYMPCDGDYHDPLGQSFDNVLSDVRSLVEMNSADFVVLGGDLNTELNRPNSERVEQLIELCNLQGLFLCLEYRPTSIDFTCENSGNRARATIDHFIASENMRANVMNYWCVHDGDNLSDHSPVFLSFDFCVEHTSNDVSNPARKPNWKMARDIDVAAYKMVLFDKLRDVNVPFDVLQCNDVECTVHDGAINLYFDQLTDCCKQAAEATIPKTGGRRRVAGRTERVAPYKDRSILWHRIWSEWGRPRDGLIYDIMKKAKADYKRAAKTVLRNQNQLSSQRMASALVDNNSRDFWVEAKRQSSKQLSMPDRVDDAQGGQAVCDMFANKYSELYNSVSYDREAMSQLLREAEESKRTGGDRGVCYSSHKVEVQDVREAVMKLKSYKAYTEDLFMSDHIINGGDALYIHLTFLFNCMLSHIVVPKQMLIAVLIPITKNKRKSIYDSSNYRSIALSSIVGKVFDRMILNLHSNVLSTSDLQFGFKRNHSTTQCTFVLNQVVHYYTARESSCFALLLDASKAFDRVEYVRLFSLLRERGLCSRLCLLLALLYTKQTMRVRWKSCVSGQFQCSNGVKQGGVLSPTLFCIFFDVLLGLLQQSGVGCFVGHRFVGALSYADDIALLAPTAGCKENAPSV